MPSQAHLEAHGLSLEDYEDDATECWPENGPVLEVFSRVSTQWRVAGMGGYVGLDYTALYRVMDEMGYRGPDWLQMLDDIAAMEAGAMARRNSKQD